MSDMGMKENIIEKLLEFLSGLQEKEEMGEEGEKPEMMSADAKPKDELLNKLKGM